MATERVESTRLVTEYEEYEVCDKCGLEPEESLIPLYRDIEREVLDNHEDREVEWSPRLLIESRQFLGASAIRYVVPAGSCHIFESRPDPIVEVCEACYDEMFGWRDDD